jgi:hypothetical protein
MSGLFLLDFIKYFHRIETGKQGGTALTRPMHYRKVVHGIFYAQPHAKEICR